MHLLRISRLYAVAILATACGDAAGPDYAPALAGLRGVITASDVPAPSEVRVAFAWRKRDPEGNILRASQDVAVRAEFPVRFSLAVTRLPPAESMNDGMSSTGVKIRYATGTVIVYEDRNRNERLDLVATDAIASPDRVLGAPAGMSVFYVEGPIAPPEGSLGPHPGFNLRREATLTDPAPGADPCAPVKTTRQEYLALDTEIPLVLTAAPELSRQICERTPPPTTQGEPQHAQVTCAADGTAFVAKSCDEPAGLCASSTCSYTCGRRPSDQPPPPDWPCP
jgi:hypothetical protein